MAYCRLIYLKHLCEICFLSRAGFIRYASEVDMVDLRDKYTFNMFFIRLLVFVLNS